MATAYTGRLGAHQVRAFPVRLLDKYFYFGMSLLIVPIVIGGFSLTINRHLFHPKIQPPAILWYHGAIFFGWLLFFILQSALVRTRNVKWHRTLGWFGAGLGTAVFILGVSTTVVMHQFEFLTLHRQNVAIISISIPLFDMVCFGVTFGLAILWRKKPEYHRRLLLAATCALTAAAWGRIPELRGFWFYSGVDFLIFLGVVRDLVVNRRVHRVYLLALPMFIIGQVIVAKITFTQGWFQIAKSLLGV